MGNIGDGMKLRQYIAEEGVTVGDFAKRVGASEGAVVKWCRGERIPGRDMMHRIARATRGYVRPDDFFDLPIEMDGAEMR